jgi:hypothetical protein
VLNYQFGQYDLIVVVVEIAMFVKLGIIHHTHHMPEDKYLIRFRKNK